MPAGVNIILKICFMVISVCSSICMFRLLKALPCATENHRQNLKKFARYGAISPLTDIALIVLTALTISPGEYGTGVELLLGLLVFISYLPIVIVNAVKLKKRFALYKRDRLALYDEEQTSHEAIRLQNSLILIYYSIPFKCILFMLIPVSLEPYYVGWLEKMIL